MLRFFLLSCFLFGAIVFSEAQIISVSSDTTFINTYGNAPENGFATIHNFSSDTLHLRWHRIVVSSQPNWVSSICDNDACHATSDNFADFNISPNDSGFIELTLDPNNSAGDGVINIEVYNPLDSLNLNAIAIFSIHVSETNSIIDNQQQFFFKIFPNPSSSFISLESSSNHLINEIRIFDLNGRMVSKYFFDNFNGAEKVNISNLSTGKYFIELITNDVKCYTTSFMK